MESQVWDRRAALASRVSDVIESAAREHFKLDIDELTHLRWSELMQLMREIDSASDAPGSKHNILDALSAFTQFNERYPHLSPASLGQEAHDIVVARAATILTDSERLQTAETYYRYLAARQHEAIHTARLFADVASPNVAAQSGFHGSFMPMLERLTIAANYFDSARDLKDDANQNLIRIDPEPKLRLDLLARTARGIVIDYDSFLHGRMILPYAKLCLVGYYSHHIKNKDRRRKKR